MDLSSFVKASISKKLPNNFPVSHPERGFAIITEKQWELWQQWGYQKESWTIPGEKLEGVKKARRTRKPRIEE